MITFENTLWQFIFLDWVWNCLRDTPLGISVRVFSENINWRGKTYSEIGWHQAIAGVYDWRGRKENERKEKHDTTSRVLAFPFRCFHICPDVRKPLLQQPWLRTAATMIHTMVDYTFNRERKQTLPPLSCFLSGIYNSQKLEKCYTHNRSICIVELYLTSEIYIVHIICISL